MCLESVAVKLLRDAGPNSGVKRFCSIPSRNSRSEKNSDPTLQSHPTEGPVAGLHEKSSFVQPFDWIGRGSAAECDVTQNSQIAPLQITLHPRTRFWSLQQFRPPGDKLTSSEIIPIIINRQTLCRIPDSGSESPIHSAGCGWRFRLLDFYPQFSTERRALKFT